MNKNDIRRTKTKPRNTLQKNFGKPSLRKCISIYFDEIDERVQAGDTPRQIVTGLHSVGIKIAMSTYEQYYKDECKKRKE